MTGFNSKRKMAISRMGDEIQGSCSWGLRNARGWKLKLCILPKRCFLSDKPLWGKLAYHGIRMITGPGEPVYEHYWIAKDEFLFWNLRREH